MDKRLNTTLRCFAAAAIVVLMSGCGESGDGLPRVGVTGKVYLNGELLPDGLISFLPTSDTPGPSVGGKIENGIFEIPQTEGPCVGKHRIQIRSIRQTGRQISGGQDSDTSQMVDEVKQIIPERYNRKTELNVELAPNLKEELIFELEAPGV
ncbi:MAG: hypothetical protein ACIALR_06925 [Blastopirellula sp. JB062]